MKILVDQMPEYREACPFFKRNARAYDNTTNKNTVAKRSYTTKTYDTCSLSKEEYRPCSYYQKHYCDHLVEYDYFIHHIHE